MASYIRVDRKMVEKTLRNDWSISLNGQTTLVVANDAKANDELLSNMLLMTDPACLKKVIVRTMERAIHILHGENVKVRPYYFITNNIADVAKLVEEGTIEEVNVAQVKAEGDDIIKITDFAAVTKADAEILKGIMAKGIRVYSQMGPSASPIELKDIL